MLNRIQLDKGWEFKQSTSLGDGAAQGFLPVAQFPTVSFIDLLHHKIIPDPYVDTNEIKTLWVNHADWTYRNQSIGPFDIASGEKATLVFEGLDTVVDVYLDGQHILFSKNMHVAHRVDVTELLRGKKEPSNLELRFTSAIPFSRKERERIGYKGHEDDIHYGGSERLFLRKAQYSWGWDWGPTVQSSGPWKPIYLERFQTRIVQEKLLITPAVAEDLQSATLAFSGSITDGDGNLSLKAELMDPSGTTVISEQTVSVAPNRAFESSIKLGKPQLWYPFQHGSQPLYTLKLSLGDSDVYEKKIGFRRVRVLEHPLKNAEGNSFVFEINNIRMFCGGSCWIPGDFLLPRMTRERYEAWVTLAKAGNQSMIRVWGGGIVEDDHFWDVCDREGVLVWQDFLFACGNYPASPDFVENFKQEAEQQVLRVGHRPSLAIWAGNNEDYMLANRWGWEWDPNDETGPWDHTDFPARLIYEKTLPEIIEKLGRGVPYIRSSPYGGYPANDSKYGDVHIWEVWHGQMAPYQDYKKFMGRFVSEFGFESTPNLRTLNKAITDPRERHSQSRTWLTHDKAPGHTRRYGMYMSENFRFLMNPIDAYVYCTQFLQAEAMSYAYNLWRREFRGPGEENCSGALVWQLNDIWPGMSWALVDVDLHPKAAFFVVKRALQMVAVGIERVITKKIGEFQEVINIEPEKKACEIWAVNGHVEELDVKLKLAAFDIESGKRVKVPEIERSLTLPANRSTDLCRIDIPNAEWTVLVAYLEDAKTGAQLARWVSWPEPLKYLRFRADVEVTTKAHEDSVVLGTTAPVKGVVLEVPLEEGADAKWEDNFIDLVPDEEVTVGVKGLNGRTVKARWLCDWELAIK